MYSKQRKDEVNASAGEERVRLQPVLGISVASITKTEVCSFLYDLRIVFWFSFYLLIRAWISW
jgi:hypothetical protein